MAGEAKAKLDAVVATMSSFADWPDTDSAGSAVTVSLVPVAVPGVGDQSFAFGTSFDNQTLGKSLRGVAFVRRGDTLVWVILRGIALDPSGVLEFARLADAKLEGALASGR